MIRPLCFLLLLITQAPLVIGDDTSSSSDRSVLPAPNSTRTRLEQRALDLRKEIEQAANSFSRHLDAVAQSEEGAEFVARLDWASVKSELDKPQPDLFLLRSFSKRLYEPIESFHVEGSVLLRKSLDKYTDVRRVLLCEDIEAETERRKTAVQSLLAAEGRLDTVQIGEHLYWLELVGISMQSPSLQDKYDQANIAVDIPKSVVTERITQFDQKVEQNQYVSNVVAGTPISGYAYTTGAVTAQLLPDESAAGFRVSLQGVINAPSNVAVQDPVVVYTSGQTTFAASKQIAWDGNKLSWGPTNVSCQTQSSITGIEVTRQPILPLRRRPGPLNRVIERAAWRRAEQQQPQGEAAASSLAEGRVAESFNDQVSELVGKLNGQIEEYVTQPLRQVGMMPSIDAVIKPDDLCVSLLRKGPAGLAAGSDRPNWNIPKDEFALYIHESALTNFIHASAGGAVWTDQRFSDLQRAVIGTNSHELRIGLHERWQVILDWNRPLVTRFDKDRITIQINVETLQIEQEDFRYPFSVEASYEFDTRPPSIGMLRVGDLRFKWTSDNRPGSGEQEVKLSNFIREKFSGFLTDEFYLDGLKIPAGGGFWGALGKYRSSYADSKQGWMLIAFGEEKVE